MMRGRWFILLAAALAWIVAMVAWVGGDPRLSSTAYDDDSAYNTGPKGLSQAFAYLAARHANVRALTRDVGLERPDRGAVILRIGAAGIPAPPPIEHFEDEKPPDEKAKAKRKKDEKPAPPTTSPFSILSDEEERWVRAGGRMIVAPSDSESGIHLDTHDCGAYRQVFPVVPPLPLPDVPQCASLSGPALQRFHSLVIDDKGPVIARQPIGAGDVILFSLPSAFANGNLARGANLALLESLVAGRGPIYFDETVHGIEQSNSIAELLIDEWRLGPALLLLAAAALLLFWRKARTTGRADRPDEDIRSDAVDLVQSLGQLYDRAVDRDEALRLYYHALVRAVHARTGLTGDALDRLVSKRTEGFDPTPHFHDISREEFQRMLKILNHAYETVAYANTR